MGKRRKGTGRKAYLKHKKSFYDPLSAYALRTRGAKAINIAGLVRDPETKRLVPIEYTATQTHGIRGLTLKRAIGPVAVAVHVPPGTHTPTVIPKAELQLKALKVAEGKAQWAAQRYSGIDEWHRVVLRDVRPYKMEEYWFCGPQHRIIITDWERSVEKRSTIFSSKETLMAAFKHQRIRWEVIPIPPLKPGG